MEIKVEIQHASIDPKPADYKRTCIHLNLQKLWNLLFSIHSYLCIVQSFSLKDVQRTVNKRYFLVYVEHKF